jgi:hypothetical protein
MRFSAAILQIAPREPARVRPLTSSPAERPQAEPQEPAREAVQEPPPDLDQRVRLSGEW